MTQRHATSKQCVLRSFEYEYVSMYTVSTWYENMVKSAGRVGATLYMVTAGISVHPCRQRALRCLPDMTHRKVSADLHTAHEARSILPSVVKKT